MSGETFTLIFSIYLNFEKEFGTNERLRLNWWPMKLKQPILKNWWNFMTICDVPNQHIRHKLLAPEISENIVVILIRITISVNINIGLLFRTYFKNYCTLPWNLIMLKFLKYQSDVSMKRMGEREKPLDNHNQ